MTKTFCSSSANHTKKIGRNLAKEILFSAAPGKKAQIVGLVGDLGAGKTTFLQGFAMELGIKEKILSPTFVLLKKFTLSAGRFKNFYHLDCYRMERPKELLHLGFREIIAESQNLILIEWADRIQTVLPKDTIWIKFEAISPERRRITITLTN